MDRWQGYPNPLPNGGQTTPQPTNQPTVVGIMDEDKYKVLIERVDRIQVVVDKIEADIDKIYKDNQDAAKSFTVLKHDTRALRETFSNAMNDEAFRMAVQNIHERYNDLVRVVPPTTKEAFEEARKRIKQKILRET